jgi:hypothetical protein
MIVTIIIPEYFSENFAGNNNIEIEIFDIGRTTSGMKIARIINPHDNEYHVVVKENNNWTVVL